MNREIKFRGKTLKQHTIDGKVIPAGTWIYGYYYKYHDSHRIIMPAYLQSQIALDVDPHTVGQFTGRYDKNNTPVYEGDVIRFFGERNDNKGKLYERKIEYGDSMFVAYDLNMKATIPMRDNATYKWEVVGNIYDNPEMDKEGKH